jgi:hypothetical protein
MQPFSEYEKLVRAGVEKTGRKDIINDLKTYGSTWIEVLYKRGYSVHDAIRSLQLNSQELDETWACEELQKLAEKYGH